MTMVLPGRTAKVAATQALKRKARSLTLKKDILTLKCWGGKRGELWKCGKAALTQEGCIMVHSAGPFVGYFLVGRVKNFYSVRDAFEWIGHEKFVPQSPSIDASITFYHKFFTGHSNGESAAREWDAENQVSKSTIFYAWEDTLVDMYVVNDEGRATWTFPQQQPRRTEGPKYRGYDIRPGANILLTDTEQDLLVLSVVTRMATQKNRATLKLVSGASAFKVRG